MYVALVGLGPWAGIFLPSFIFMLMGGPLVKNDAWRPQVHGLLSRAVGA